VASFAFGQRHAVLDTNVRRVLARLVTASRGRAGAVAGRAAAGRVAAARRPAVAARWSVAVMELGALVCTAASPRCADCPVARTAPGWPRAARRKARS
jgi:A/G-specific adenine glycosylase